LLQVYTETLLALYCNDVISDLQGSSTLKGEVGRQAGWSVVVA